MIKQSVFEDALIDGMQRNLRQQKIKTPNLTKAAENLHAALEIFEQQGMTKQAGQVLGVLTSIAQKADRHTKGLTPDKEIANLKHHGTMFNLADVPPMKSQLSADDMDADFAEALNSANFDFGASDDELMGKEIMEDDLEVFDKMLPLSDFEEEKD